MAFFVENDVIHLTKGDDAVLEVRSITADNGAAYTLRAGDVLTLTVRERPQEESPALVQVDALPGSNRIVIRHADTANAPVGRHSADVQLTTAEGLHYTVWPSLVGSGRYSETKSYKNFVIMPEVTTK